MTGDFNAANLVVGILVAAVIISAIVVIVVRKKKGKRSCGCDCGHCSGCSGVESGEKK